MEGVDACTSEDGEIITADYVLYLGVYCGAWLRWRCMQDLINRLLPNEHLLAG